MSCTALHLSWRCICFSPVLQLRSSLSSFTIIGQKSGHEASRDSLVHVFGLSGRTAGCVSRSFTQLRPKPQQTGPFLQPPSGHRFVHSRLCRWTRHSLRVDDLTPTLYADTRTGFVHEGFYPNVSNSNGHNSWYKWTSAYFTSTGMFQ